MALSRLPPPVFAASAILRVFSSDMEARSFLYCVAVAVASASITTVLPVAAEDRALKWPLNYSIKDAWGALALTLGRSFCGRGCDAVDGDDGVCGFEGVGADRQQSCLLFKSLVEGGGVILPRLQGMVLWDFAVPLGEVLGEGVRLEEQGGCNSGKKVVQKRAGRRALPFSGRP